MIELASSILSGEYYLAEATSQARAVLREQAGIPIVDAFDVDLDSVGEFKKWGKIAQKR
jgi:hypothetical protein